MFQIHTGLSSTRLRATLAAALLVAGLPAPRAADLAHQGGKLRLLASSGAGTLDPQVNYTLQFAQLYVSVYDGLVTFKKASGAASYTIVPDLAEAITAPSDGGRTYTFTLRPGIRFSNGSEVTVDDVAASFRRIFKVLSPTAGTFYNLLVGADECLKVPATCTLEKGVSVDRARRSIVFHLVRADPEFLDKLAFGHAVILPASTPARDAGVKPIPGTGPYMFVAYDPKKELRLVRNPAFHAWNPDAQPEGYVDEIDYDFGLSDEDQTTAVANGQADWTFDSVPADRLSEIGTRYPGQVVISPLAAMHYLPMNTRIPPFDHIEARQAVNLAVDRNIAVKLLGGTRLATPTCQLIPPGIAGHVDYCPWTRNPGSVWTAPDIERARALVKQSGTLGQKVTLVAPDTAIGRAIGTYVRGVLSDLGYDASLKVLAQSIQYTYIQNSNNRVQIAFSDWYQDYPEPSDFLNVLFACAAFHPGSDASINISEACDPALDAQMTRAMELASTNPAAAAEAWAAADRKVVDAAYVAPLYNPKHLDFISKRVGHFVFSAETYFIPALAWLR
jgi:peptide/nickel transport system substrate-binding protein